jgi:hypothetical protein
MTHGLVSLAQRKRSDVDGSWRNRSDRERYTIQSPKFMVTIVWNPSGFHVVKVTFAADSEVRAFHHRAFQNSDIEELHIPPKLTELHPLTFRHTPQLSIVTSNDNPSFAVNDGVLYDASRKTILFVPRTSSASTFVIPRGVTRIAPFAFGDCINIHQIDLPTTVTVIDAGAFSGSGLTTFAIPPHVIEIGDEIFSECADLSVVTFTAPSSLTSIPQSAFAGTKIASITVPASVLRICSRAFAETPNLSEVTFPSNSQCTVIDDNVFWGSSVRTLLLPRSLTTLRANFFGCLNLETVSVPFGAIHFSWERGILWDGGFTQIFFALRSLRGIVEIPDTVTRIHANAFAHCEGVTSVHFGRDSQLGWISAWAFFCSGLTEIEIPPKVIFIGDGAFGGCEKLKRVTFCDGSTTVAIGAQAFRRSGLEAFQGPPSLETLGRGAFSCAPRLHTAVLPPRISVVPPGAFAECEGFETVRSERTAGTITVGAGAFPAHFDRACFRHDADVSVVWPDSGPSAVRRECAKPPGTSTQDYIIDDADFVRIEGSGTHSPIGDGYPAERAKTGEVVWVKSFTEADVDSVLKQSEIFARVVHPAILGMIGFVIPAQDVSGKLVTEFMPNGSLERVIRDQARYGTLSPTEKVKIAVGIVMGMRYLHACGVFHSDLKPANILLDEKFEVRIADFRTARLVDVTGVTMTGGLGSSHFYMAPEFCSDRYGKEVDLFAFAMIFWEIVNGGPVSTKIRAR